VHITREVRITARLGHVLAAALPRNVFQHSVRLSQLVGLCLCILSLGAGDVLASQYGSSDVKRRQQGILTGMPFMTHITPRTFVDDLGRKLFLAKAPTRVVSLAPSITEILYAIGLDEEIVGVTEFCDYPPAAQQKPKIGYAQPNIEAIVTLQPDLVLATRAFLRADLLAKLEQLKIPTFVVDPESFEEIPSRIQTVGRILNRSSSADTVATAMRQRIASIRNKMEAVARVRVLYVLNSQPLITVGPGSYIHQVIAMAGGSNIASQSTVPYPHLNMETVLKEDPEIIVFPIGKAEGIPPSEQQQWLRWTSLAAVKQGRLHQISADVLNRPGPRIVEGLETLARIIHPEAFVASVAP
jgi:iron complex transport system substrate-binding protein